MIEVLSLHFTDRCTRKCPNCYIKPGAKPARNLEFFLPFAEIARELGIKQIALGGGEPTLYPEFVSKLAASCRKNEVILNMTTNGDGFTRDSMAFFEKVTLVSFSIDRHKILIPGDLQTLFSKMDLAREAGLAVGANVQLDPFIIEHLYEMLGELFQYCEQVYLLQPKPNPLCYDAKLKMKLLTARCLYDHLYADESLLMSIGSSVGCGRGQRIVSVDFAGGVSACSFDQNFAKLEKPRDLIQVVAEYYPYPETTKCPFLEKEH